jgi:predicted NUDIX family NTP pyrophosphohydrolase
MTSAGVLLFRRRDGDIEVLIVHPGGPFWAGRDDGAWSVPKGEPQPGEEPFEAALREFTEETGFTVDGSSAVDLGEITQKAGKTVRAWAIEGDADPAALRSNTFTTEWPPRSGRMQSFPEIDRAAWMTPDVACAKLNPAQAEFMHRLKQILA